ncbi:hypothetical protein VW35_12090 [Devosia soli]|uniref:Uncharacterized protein n=1 Tax=Devosia soli TaxID=361041 RepID=A0A0F5L828_9HYPH|nr:hypothetical protein [Devosia soli]KKB78364.1 hypothetical protein VW35_12090 [Devosia soli]
MDPKPTEPKVPEVEIGAVTPDMRVAASEKLGAIALDVPNRRRRRARPGVFLAGVAAIVGLAALGTSVWIYTEMQREMLRVSKEIAQVRLSLDLYAQRTNAAASPGAAAPADTSALSALENRLAVLEQNWRTQPGAGGTQPATLPPIAGAPVVSAESDGDCLPSGTRLLVAAGDSYPVCGTEASVDVMNVSNGYISLKDGTTVPSGSSVPLNGTACMIAVTSGGDEATTGFAEIRVSC